METISSTEVVHRNHQEFYNELGNHSQRNEANVEFRKEFSTNQDLEGTIDLVSAELLEDELSDLISEAKKRLLRQPCVCYDDDSFINGHRVSTTETLNVVNASQCVKVYENTDLVVGDGLSENDIAVNHLEELQLSSDVKSEVNIENITDTQGPVQDGTYCILNTESTDRRNSFSDNSSEVEENVTTMRWKKKGDHPEYSKEEFKEEYCPAKVGKTREKNGSSKRSQKEDRKHKSKNEACGMGKASDRNPHDQKVVEQANNSSEITAAKGICWSHTSSGLNTKSDPNKSNKQTLNSGFSGGFSVAPPKPPRIQSQLSEPAVASHLLSTSNQPNPPKARSMSLPVPPPKPKRSVVDGIYNEAINNESQMTSHQNGKPSRSNPQLITSQLKDEVQIHKRSEMSVQYLKLSDEFSDEKNNLIGPVSEINTQDCQLSISNDGTVNGGGGTVILRNKQKHGNDKQDNAALAPRPPAHLLDFPDDGLLRDDITGDIGLNPLDIDSDDEMYIDGMHFRGWTWVYIGDDAELNAKLENEGKECKSQLRDISKDETSSISTTASEKEFKIQVKTGIERKSSKIDYQRVSMYVRERDIALKKKNGVFGFRIQRSRPVVVTEVDKGGAAEDAGIKVGDVIVSINGNDVCSAPHSDVVKLASCTNENDQLSLVVGTNVCNSLNLSSDEPVMSGYMYKRGGTGLIQSWRKRWFVLKHDNCLYYYKTENDVDPLGAIVLASYTVVKAWDLDKPFAFKLKKFKARTYYFHTTSEEERNMWCFAITDATHQSVKSDIWMGVSTHNVSIPALSITNPECIGYLTKRGNRHKTWRRRFFVLKDACMYYYENNSSPTALGVVHFHGYTIQEIRTSTKKFPFDLIPPEPDLRTYHFQADHETDRKRWVAALASSIGKWIRTDVCNSDDDEGCEMLI